MSLANYLANKYLTADAPKEKKSKKRKRKEATEGLTIADDDAPSWNASAKHDDEDGPTMVTSRSTDFRKSKKSAWTTVGAPAPTNSEQAAADAILAAAAAESAAKAQEDDEAPEVVDDSGVLKMESGAHAGLQTGAQVAAQLKKKQAEERRKAREVEDEMGGGAQETIYRDASGRIINVAMKRAEARKKAEEAERAKREAEEALKGDVQRAERSQRKQQLEDAKYMTLARGVDDVELNEELKEVERWNDPAAKFIAKKKSGKSVTGKPLYKGSAPPNRYGIRPGYRWDGVDRSNGYEKEYFAARNKRENIKNLRYQWEMDE